MLDLTGYKLTFDDEFDSLSISQDGVGTTWRDIRPGSRMGPNADIGFGDSAFVDPGSGVNPFSLQNGALDITAVQAPSSVVGPGTWASGLISSQGNFSQEYGYFEMRAEMPQDTGVWPAFWLLPNSQTWPPEADVVEEYGGPGLYSYVHTNETGTPTWQQVYSSQPTQTSGYHTYGMMWDPQHITFYYDGQETGQIDTPADMHQAMYLVADLAMQSLASVTSDPKNLNIDYIRAYSDDPNATAVALQPVSSPDGADTSSLYGATAANTPTTVANNGGTSTPTTVDSGGTSTPTTVGDSGSTSPPTTSGSGAASPPSSAGGQQGSLTLHVSADHYDGDPQFLVFVDGQQVGGPQSVDAIHSQGQWQDITVSGNFDPNAAHQIDVQFINDAWDGQLGEGNDRNLYIGGVTIGGHTIAGQDTVSNTASNGYDSWDPNAAVMVTNGTAEYDVPASSTADTGATGSTTPAGTTTGSAPTGGTSTAGTTTTGDGSLTLHVSADHYDGDPQFVVFVDGQQVGGPQSVDAIHSQGQWQDITVSGNFDPNAAHQIDVQFINDAWDGQLGEGNDRNLYIGSVTIGGHTIAGQDTTSNTASNGYGSWDPNAAVMVVDGTAHYDVPASSTADAGGTTTGSATTGSTTTGSTTTTGQGSLTLHMSADHYDGDPQFEVFVDGQQVGGVESVQAIHSQGQWQDITVSGNFDPTAAHTVAVQFINDAWDGQLGEGNDRNLYVGSLTIDGNTIAGQDTVSNTASNGYDGWDPNAAVMVTNGSAVYSTPAASSPQASTATGTSSSSSSPASSSSPSSTGTSDAGTLTLHVSADHYNGDPEFQVFVDGQQLGGTESVQAVHSQGQWQDITLTGNFDPNASHEIDVKFINDAWDGQLGEGNDRNLYVGSVTIGDHVIAGTSATSNTAQWGGAEAGWDPNAAVMATNGTVTFQTHASDWLLH